MKVTILETQKKELSTNYLTPELIHETKIRFGQPADSNDGKKTCSNVVIKTSSNPAQDQIES